MLSSMTGFGRAVLDAPFGKLVVEIQSVNRKHLEISVSLPKEWGRFEHEVRKWICDAISRGHVSVRIFVIPNATAIETLLPDLETLHELKKGWDRLASKMGLDSRSVDLPFLVSQLPEQDQTRWARDEDLQQLHRCLDEALQALVKMRRTEGKTLAHDLAQRLQTIENELAEIEKLSPEVVAKMRQKLTERMAEVLAPNTELDERLLREVALFAERIDIAEEVTRLRSHLAQFNELLRTKSIAIGRKMDFLVQEIGREINTIGSKCSEAKITARVVEMKSELEKMREQIQNIE